MGIFGVFRISREIVVPFVRFFGNEDDVEMMQKNPVLFFRSLSNPAFRAFGRFMFPMGELRNITRTQQESLKQRALAE